MRSAFWELYWGEMAVVESPAVEAVMVEIGRHIPSDATGLPTDAERKELQELAKKLAAECRVDIP